MANFDFLQTERQYNDMINAVQTAAGQQAAALQKVGDAITSASQANIAFMKEQAAIARADLAPFREAGQRSTKELENMLGLNGAAAQAKSYEMVLQNPETQQILQFGVDAFNKSAASKGMLRSGRTVESLFKLGTDIARSQVSNKQNMLFNLASMGEAAAAQSAQQSMALGQQVAGQNTWAAENMANMYMAQGNLASQTTMQVAQLNAMKPQSSGSPLGKVGMMFGGGALAGLFGGGAAGLVGGLI